MEHRRALVMAEPTKKRYKRKAQVREEVPEESGSSFDHRSNGCFQPLTDVISFCGGIVLRNNRLRNVKPEAFLTTYKTLNGVLSLDHEHGKHQFTPEGFEKKEVCSTIGINCIFSMRTASELLRRKSRALWYKILFPCSASGSELNLKSALDDISLWRAVGKHIEFSTRLDSV